MRQNFCAPNYVSHDKRVSVMTKLLSRQNIFVMTKNCHDKHTFVATKDVFFHDKNDIWGSSHQWYSTTCSKTKFTVDCSGVPVQTGWCCWWHCMPGFKPSKTSVLTEASYSYTLCETEFQDRTVGLIKYNSLLTQITATKIDIYTPLTNGICHNHDPMKSNHNSDACQYY